MRPPLSEADLDRVAGSVYATPQGRVWLQAAETVHPAYVAEIRARIARCRARWGDRSTKDNGQ